MKVKEGIIGLVVGDALGVPVEFSSRESLKENPITGMTGGGTYGMPAGTWSDDSSMVLATMTSITNKKGLDLDDMMNEFCEWFFKAKYTQYHDTFDFGMTTSTAIQRYKKGIPVDSCGGKGEHDNGNGSLMRILPLAFLPDVDFETIEKVSALTHAHKTSRIACALYVQIAKSILENDDLTLEEHVRNASKEIKDYYDEKYLKHFQRIFNLDFSKGILSGGYVVDSLESAVYCLTTTDNYRDAVLNSVNLGGDTDTTAAICGGLAGIYYGFDAIPIEWTDAIPKLDYVLSLCEEFEAFCDEH
jgi:ADP-ribosylglycohydrolase